MAFGAVSIIQAPILTLFGIWYKNRNSSFVK